MLSSLSSTSSGLQDHSSRLRRIFLTTSLCVALTACSSGPTVTTVAGNGQDGNSGDGGPATSAEMNSIFGVAVDSSGNFYIADAASEVIRKVTVSTGIITTVAGNGSNGYSGDKGPATAAQLNFPFGIAIDSANNLYIADRGNNLIRKVTASTGIISTVAGNGSAAFSGDGGLATLASLNGPENIAIDASGNLFVTDFENSRIREIAAASGIITTVAGGGKSSSEGVAATSAHITPDCVAIDNSGNLDLCNRDIEGVQKIALSTGILSLIAGNGTYGEAGNGGPASSAELSTPFGIAFSSTGNMYVADYGSGSVRRIDMSSGMIDSVENSPTFQSPAALAINAAGNLYVADTSLREVRMITTAP
jgi:sugar lactone lactonase YvrE